MAGHRILKNLTSSKEIINSGGAYIELIENYPCNNKEELCKREGELIRQHKTDIINMVIPNRTMKEYKIDNKDKIRDYFNEYRKDNKDKINNYLNEYRKDNKDKINNYRNEYRKNNKDKIRELIKCECGREITKNNFSTHKKSKLHNDLINKTIRI
jgi:hypothetical protein